MALSALQIQTLFQNVLQRDASPAELATWLSASSSGAVTDAQIYAAIVGSEEAQNGVHAVLRIYQAAFGRVADKGGLDQQTDSLVRGGFTVNSIAAGFVVSQEFANRFNNGALLADTAAAVSDVFLQALYLNVLGRAGSTAEIAAWKAEVARGQAYKNASDVLYGFSQSAEFIQKAAPSISNFLTLAGQGLATYSGPLIESAVPSTFTLTSGTDNYPGTPGNNTINAVFDANSIGNTTLNATDTINGGAGTDLLSVKVTSLNSTFAWPTVTNVEQISITPQTSNGVFTTNLSTVSGLQTLTLDFAGLSSSRMLVTLPTGLTSVDAKGGVAGNRIVATSSGPDTTNDIFTWNINNLNSSLYLRQSNGSTAEKIVINNSGTSSISADQSNVGALGAEVGIVLKSPNVTITGGGALIWNPSGAQAGGPTILDASSFNGTGTFVLGAGTANFIGGPGADTVTTADGAYLTLGPGADIAYLNKITYQTITDFNPAEDKIFFGKNEMSLLGTTKTYVLNNYDNYTDWFAAGVAARNVVFFPGTPNSTVVAYRWKGETYLFYDVYSQNGQAVFDVGTDSMVRIQGVTLSNQTAAAILDSVSFFTVPL